ncbi:hypothetical protein STEG23_030458 [Scotinomys teguina]
MRPFTHSPSDLLHTRFSQGFDLVDLSIGWNLPSSAFGKAGFVDRLGLFMVSQISWTFCVITSLDLVFSLTDESISSIVNCSLIERVCLKPILFDTRIATPAYFLSPFDWKAFSQPFTLSGLIIICSLREFFISSLRASITFCKSFLVMNSASSVLAKMGRRQCKSAYNIIKNKTTPESSPPPTPKSDYCNADKAEENDLKKSLMKMLEEAFEEKMKNVSKEIGENTNKKLEEINKEIEEKKSKKLEEMNNEIEEKKNKKLEEMNNEIEEKKNKRVEEMNKEIEEKRNKKLQELDKEIEEKINKKLKEMNKEIEEKTNKKLEEINKVIQLTFGPFHPILDDHEQFPYLYQMAPKDTSLALAMISLMLHFSWSWIGLTISDNDQGIQFLSYLRREMEENIVCFAFVNMIPVNMHLYMSTADVYYNRIMASSSNVVIIYGDTDSTLAVCFRRWISQGTQRIWVTTSQWDLTARKSDFTLDSSHRTLAFAHHHAEVSGFKNFLQTLSPLTTNEYLASLEWMNFHCEVSDSNCKTLKNCSSNASLEWLMGQTFDMAFNDYNYDIYDAVHIVAHSFQEGLLQTVADDEGYQYNCSKNISLPEKVNLDVGINLKSKARTSTTILNKYEESGKPCLVPDFSGIALSFSPFNLMRAVGLL